MSSELQLNLLQLTQEDLEEICEEERGARQHFNTLKRAFGWKRVDGSALAEAHALSNPTKSTADAWFAVTGNAIDDEREKNGLSRLFTESKSEPVETSRRVGARKMNLNEDSLATEQLSKTASSETSSETSSESSSENSEETPEETQNNLDQRRIPGSQVKVKTEKPFETTESENLNTENPRETPRRKLFNDTDDAEETCTDMDIDYELMERNEKRKQEASQVLEISQRPVSQDSVSHDTQTISSVEKSSIEKSSSGEPSQETSSSSTSSNSMSQKKRKTPDESVPDETVPEKTNRPEPVAVKKRKLETKKTVKSTKPKKTETHMTLACGTKVFTKNDRVPCLFNVARGKIIPIINNKIVLDEDMTLTVRHIASGYQVKGQDGLVVNNYNYGLAPGEFLDFPLTSYVERRGHSYYFIEVTLDERLTLDEQKSSIGNKTMVPLCGSGIILYNIKEQTGKDIKTLISKKCPIEKHPKACTHEYYEIEEGLYLNRPIKRKEAMPSVYSVNFDPKTPAMSCGRKIVPGMDTIESFRSTTCVRTVNCEYYVVYYRRRL